MNAAKQALVDAKNALDTAIDTTFRSRQATPGANQAVTRLDYASKAVQKAIEHVDAAASAISKKSEKKTTATTQA